MKKIFRDLDYFRKNAREVIEESSQIGGVISLVTSVLVVVLILYEIFVVFFGPYKSYPFLNNYSTHTKVRIHMNITFQEMFCSALSVDYQDISGTHLENISHTLHKLRLDKFGKFIEPNEANRIRQENLQQIKDSEGIFDFVDGKVPVQSSPDFGIQNSKLPDEQKRLSCYGAELYEEPMKEQILQCLEGSKAEFKTVQRIDGSSEKGVVSIPNTGLILNSQEDDQLIEELKRMNIVEQLMSQIDSSLIETLSPRDREYFDTTMDELNELQYNPDEVSDMEVRMEIMGRVQELQVLLGGYLKKSQDKKISSILDMSVSSDLINLKDLVVGTKVQIFSFSVRRSLCFDTLVYKVGLTSDMDLFQSGASENSNIQRTFLKASSSHKMKDEECAHIFPVFVERSPISNSVVIISIPDLEIQEQYVMRSSEWKVKVTLIKDEGTSFVMGNHPQKVVRVSYTEPKQEDKQPPMRMLFAQNFGHEHIHGSKMFTGEDLMKLQEQSRNQEKCQIYGYIDVKKIPGNFHISFHNEGLLTLYMNQNFNLQHKIHVLEFTPQRGKPTGGSISRASNPLDGTQHNTGYGIDNDYYLKVVNTIYENLIGEHSDIYSFTNLETRGIRDYRLPSVNFRYEFDPISVLHYRKSRSIAQFSVTLCAIVGGLIAISKLIHNLLVK